MKCSICSTELPKHEPGYCGGTGYGYDRRLGEDKPICYPCCAILEAWDMCETGKATLYLTCSGSCHVQNMRYYCGEQHKISGWSGIAPYRVYSASKSKGWGFGGSYERHDVRFIGPDGAMWHGRQQGDNQILRCKRLKSA